MNLHVCTGVSQSQKFFFFFFSFPFINSSGSLSSEELKTIIFGVLDSLFLPEVNQDT